MLFLPEAADFIITEKDALKLSQAKECPAFLESLKEAASQHQIWVSVGVHEPAGPNTLYNTNVLIDNSGTIAAKYRKIHLFDVVFYS